MTNYITQLTQRDIDKIWTDVKELNKDKRFNFPENKIKEIAETTYQGRLSAKNNLFFYLRSHYQVGLFEQTIVFADRIKSLFSLPENEESEIESIKSISLLSLRVLGQANQLISEKKYLEVYEIVVSILQRWPSQPQARAYFDLAYKNSPALQCYIANQAYIAQHLYQQMRQNSQNLVSKDASPNKSVVTVDCGTNECEEKTAETSLLPAIVPKEANPSVQSLTESTTESPTDPSISSYLSPQEIADLEIWAELIRQENNSEKSQPRELEAAPQLSSEKEKKREQETEIIEFQPASKRQKLDRAPNQTFEANSAISKIGVRDIPKPHSQQVFTHEYLHSKQPQNPQQKNATLYTWYQQNRGLTHTVTQKQTAAPQNKSQKNTNQVRARSTTQKK